MKATAGTARRGMTLLELTVALAVGGVALAGGGAAFAFLSDRRTAMAAEADTEARALNARRSLAHWLAEVRVTGDGRAPVFRGTDGTRRSHGGDVPDDELSFVTTAPTPVGDDAAEVRLFVARDAGSDDGALVAELRTGRAVAPMRVTLASHVGGLDIRYYTQAFGPGAWLANWAAGTLLPGAVVVQVFPVWGDSLPAALRLPLTIPFANGR